MNVPLLDLVAQYHGIKDEMVQAMMAVVERQGFIMGPEVGQLETEVARLSNARHAIGCASGQCGCRDLGGRFRVPHSQQGFVAAREQQLAVRR